MTTDEAMEEGLLEEMLFSGSWQMKRSQRYAVQRALRAEGAIQQREPVSKRDRGS